MSPPAAYSMCALSCFRHVPATEARMMAAPGLRDAVVIFVVTLNGQNNWQRQHLALFKPSLTAPCEELLMRPIQSKYTG